VPAHSDCHENGQPDEACGGVHLLGCPEGPEHPFHEPTDCAHDAREDQVTYGIKQPVPSSLVLPTHVASLLEAHRFQPRTPVARESKLRR
jgi:hypothetical protein